MVKGIINNKNYEETSNDYITNFLRALRNTHHGYLSERKSDFCPNEFIINRGNVTDLLPELGPFWVLALILEPDKFI